MLITHRKKQDENNHFPTQKTKWLRADNSISRCTGYLYRLEQKLCTLNIRCFGSIQVFQNVCKTVLTIQSLWIWNRYGQKILLKSRKKSGRFLTSIAQQSFVKSQNCNNMLITWYYLGSESRNVLNTKNFKIAYVYITKSC